MSTVKKTTSLFWHRFRKNKLALFGGIIVIFLLFTAFMAPFLTEWGVIHDPNKVDVEHILSPPSSDHPLGTDNLGRDVLSRMVWGSRISLKVGFISVTIALAIGITIGAIAGFYGKWVDLILRGFIDLMLCFPSFYLILTVIALLKPSIMNIMLVIGFTSWMGIARLIRAEFMTLRQREFVEAAEAIGAKNWRIIFRHILPNAIPPVIVAAILGVAGAILTEAGLSFLGIGVQPPDPSWGNILTAGKDNIQIAWWLSVCPGIGILLAVLGYNLLGEGLRDALDPKMRK